MVRALVQPGAEHLGVPGLGITQSFSCSDNALRSAYNNALKSFVALLLTRTSGFASRRLAWRYMQ